MGASPPVLDPGHLGMPSLLHAIAQPPPYHSFFRREPGEMLVLRGKLVWTRSDFFIILSGAWRPGLPCAILDVVNLGPALRGLRLRVIEDDAFSLSSGYETCDKVCSC